MDYVARKRLKRNFHLYTFHESSFPHNLHLSLHLCVLSRTSFSKKSLQSNQKCVLYIRKHTAQKIPQQHVHVFKSILVRQFWHKSSQRDSTPQLTCTVEFAPHLHYILPIFYPDFPHSLHLLLQMFPSVNSFVKKINSWMLSEECS